LNEKLKFPIYLKLVFFILLICLLSLSSYVYYATQLYQNDKVAYVYESIDNYADKNIESINDKLQHFDKILVYLAKNPPSLSSLKLLFGDDESFLSYIQFLNDGSILKFDLQKNSLIASKESVKIGLNYDHDVFQYFVKTKGSISGIFFRKEAFLNLSDIPLYKFTLVSAQESLDPEYSELSNYVYTSSKIGQTFLYTNGAPKIVSHREINRNLSFLTLTDYAKALEASKILKENSIYFGLLVAGIVILLVLLFSKILTKPLYNLSQTVDSFLNSNFLNRSRVKSSDEIGHLSLAFNKMADDIVNYMREMKEKYRIEEELKTAELVQSNFFPHKKYEYKDLAIYGHYQSATECGGDWWGSFEKEDYQVIVLADVTGHGTPAALMTAVLFNSLNALLKLCEYDDSYFKSSKKIMDYFNQLFCHATSNLNATAFVCVINKKDKSLNYTNASHTAPYLFSSKHDCLSKKDLLPLMDQIGARLGEDSSSEYLEVSLKLKSQDKILIYSDGIIEAINEKNEQYGTRKFLKSILNHFKENPEIMVSNIIKDLEQFRGHSLLNDDVSIVSIEAL